MSHEFECHVCAAAAKSRQSCLTLCDPIGSSPPGSRPWNSPGKNTGVGCHFLFQCMKVKSESEVVQSCQTLSDPTDCSPPGSPVQGIFQARVLEWGAIEHILKYNTQFFFIDFPAAAGAAKSLQCRPTLCDPIDGSHQAPPSLGFSRQKHWNGLPFPSPMHESEK